MPTEKPRKLSAKSFAEFSENPFDRREEKEKLPGFVAYVRSMGRSFSSFGKNAEFSQEQKEALSFLNWSVSAPEVRAAYFGTLFVGLFASIIVALVLFVAGLDQTIVMFAVALLLLGSFGGAYFLLSYPKRAAENEKLQALFYVPEIVNYLAISLQLNPNLEKAVEFAASHGQGKIADELKKIVWDVQLGRYYSVEEALDELAYKWGAYNDDFKQALMLIRSSVLEADLPRRQELLNKAVSGVLEGSKEKMDNYARQLHQPAVFLYYFGILLPLLLAIILPIGGSLTSLPLDKAEYMFVGYTILLPLGVFLYGRSIISSRPPTYSPPNIPANYPGIKKHSSITFLSVIVFFALVFAGFQVDQGAAQGIINSLINGVFNPLQQIVNPDFSASTDAFVIPGTLGQIQSFQTASEEIIKIPHINLLYDSLGLFVGQFTVFGFILGAGLGISLFLSSKYGERKKKQDEIRALETEFKDALYVLASRLGENKPFEEALRSAVQFLPNSKVAQRVFKRVLENITNLGMTIDAAIFDRTYGALKDIPSRTIRSGMQFLVDSVELGVNVSSKALISLALQLRNNQKIDESLRKMLEDVTVVLNMMSLFVAPVVLGVVGAMQKLIVSSFGSVASSSSVQDVPGASGFGGFASALTSVKASHSVEPTMFTLIMGIYVLEIVALLTFFNSQIEETRNDLHTYMRIASALPIAAVLYCAVVYFASGVVT